MASRDLTTFRDHCKTRANEPGADPLWDVLATEADSYLTGDRAQIEPDRTPGPGDVPMIGADPPRRGDRD